MKNSNNPEANTHKDSPVHQENYNKSENFSCRICLETEITSETGEFLQPCQCKGSMRFIHSACLKQAIISTTRYANKPLACEICGQEYKMTIDFKYRPSFKDLNKERLESFRCMLYYVGLLIGTLGIMTSLAISFIIEFKWKSYLISSQQVFIVLLFSILGCFSLRYWYFIAAFAKDSFLVQVASWKIYNHDIPLINDYDLQWKLTQYLQWKLTQYQQLKYKCV